jgi:hypothetical protein
MKSLRSISIFVLSGAMAIAAAPAQQRVPIAPTAIAAAISAAGMPISPEQVTLLTDVTATKASPALTVESMQPWGDRRMKVRMNCAESEQCLPFFVSVHTGNPSQTADAAASGSSTGAPRSNIDPKNVVVRAGAPATLLLDGIHVHIRIAVVCLENGAPGQTIRVASRDHRQTYVAKVVDQAVLRASL